VTNRTKVCCIIRVSYPLDASSMLHKYQMSRYEENKHKTRFVSMQAPVYIEIRYRHSQQNVQSPFSQHDAVIPIFPSISLCSTLVKYVCH